MFLKCLMEFAFAMSDGKLFQIDGPTNANDNSWTCVRLFFVVRSLFTVLDHNTLAFLHLTTISIRYPGAVPSYIFVHENSQFKYNSVLSLEPVKINEVWDNTIILVEVKDNLAYHILGML